ncbi:hypothetical protein [Paraburkholderia phytofirmans]|uniref:Extensin n=1 Tax=Paraburkholderia phytofirmans (strain DSM 17436 / LMG 22146 / PsJN) TaxID=398527 RepID=B2TDR9_PARPJ|nr:hypothetical protein [Paraburkholderia phytofirmans]ACD19107.1 conserved hypothetical protein [Paraburkholderia phytofirmans PsJN]
MMFDRIALSTRWLIMRNIGKALVVGLVLTEVAFAVYLLSPKSDPSTRDPGAVADGSAALASDKVQSGTLQVNAGNANGAPSPGANADDTARVAAQIPAQSAQGHITSAPAPAPARAATPEPSTQRAAQLPQQPAQPAQPRPQTVQTPAVATVLAGNDSKTATVVQPARGRDSLHRRDSSSVSSPATDELVRESAKLDPALPPPDPQAFVHDDQPHRGSNAVGAAMTEQLVRESAKLDPALPPPNPSGVH